MEHHANHIATAKNAKTKYACHSSVTLFAIGSADTNNTASHAQAFIAKNLLFFIYRSFLYAVYYPHQVVPFTFIYQGVTYYVQKSISLGDY